MYPSAARPAIEMVEKDNAETLSMTAQQNYRMANRRLEAIPIQPGPAIGLNWPFTLTQLIANAGFRRGKYR